MAEKVLYHQGKKGMGLPFHIVQVANINPQVSTLLRGNIWVLLGWILLRINAYLGLLVKKFCHFTPTESNFMSNQAHPMTQVTYLK